MTRSTSSVRRPASRRVVGAVLAPVAALAVVAVAALPASAAPPDDAAGYLVGQLVDGDHVELGGFVQHGPTIDVGLALLAAGGQEGSLAAVTAYMTTAEALDAYVHGGGFDRPDAAYAGATGKLGFYASVVGLDVRDVAGEDLVETLLSLEGNTGRFSDRSDFGDFSNVIGQSFGVLSLTAATGVEPSDAAVQTLLDAQCDDGGFTLAFDGGGCVGTPDVTGIALQALNATDPGESAAFTPEREAAVVAAAGWLLEHREADGSYVMDGMANVNSTGYAALGVLGAGLDSSVTTAWLEGVQLADGGLPMSPGGTSDVYATSQALPALAGDSFLSLDPSVVAAAVVVDEPEPTETPTESVTPTVTATVTGTPTATETDPTLPPTGTTSSSVAGVGLGLLVLGLGTVLVARRALHRA